MADHSFPSHHRLLISREFDAVFNGSQYRSGSAEFLILAIDTNAPMSRIGIVIGKKTTPLAVNRNKIKRLVRESFRVFFNKKTNVDLVVICRPAVNKASNIKLAGTLELLWLKLSRKIPDKGNA